ncbi:hypothetical protein D3C80_1729190 [compost metagenome]
MGGHFPGLADQLEFRQAVEQGSIDARAFAGEHQRVGIGEAYCKFIQRGRLVLVKDADIMPAQPAVAVERADHVLVVVGNDNAHGGLALAVL